MALYDITLPLRPRMVVWPGDPPFLLRPVVEPDADNPFTVSEMHLSTHTGTHVDAPRHIFAHGHGVEALPLDVLVGPVRVVDARGVPAITASVLERLSRPLLPRVIFLTDNTVRSLMHDGHFHEDFVAVTEDGARWLVDHGVKLVGVDYFSVAPYGREEGPHRVLLAAGVVIVEGVDLTTVTPGDYELLCLPLKVENGDGAPARVLLRDLTATSATTPRRRE